MSETGKATAHQRRQCLTSSTPGGVSVTSSWRSAAASCGLTTQGGDTLDATCTG